VFVHFGKLSRKPTGSESSSGLGLAICKKLIELHEGEIGAQNNPEGGACFWFSLKRVPAEVLPQPV
jgi:signal transduction histidine kinase